MTQGLGLFHGLEQRQRREEELSLPNEIERRAYFLPAGSWRDRLCRPPGRFQADDRAF
jgi:hypothetical protein